MLFKDFITKDYLAVHCNTEGKAKKLLFEADKVGLKWDTGTSFLEVSHYEVYKDKTCYNLKEGYYCDFGYYKNELEFEIIEFDDIIFDEHDLKRKNSEGFFDKGYIIASALHIQDNITYDQQPDNISSGFVVCGRRHHNCFITLSILNANQYKNNLVQGFLTSNNNFLNRTEAFEVAYYNGQIRRNNIDISKLSEYELFSEDLW